VFSWVFGPSERKNFGGRRDFSGKKVIFALLFTTNCTITKTTSN
jgi:hypothetical protein